MRPLEWLICVCMLPVIFLTITGRHAPRLAVFGFLLGTVLIAHAVFEGVHWQLIPVYLAAVVLLIYAADFFRLPRFAAVSLAALCIASILATGLLSYLFPMFKLPEPTGKYEVGTRILHVVDPTRADAEMPSGHRELMVQAWYPAQLESRWQRLATYRRLKETNLRSSYQSVLRTHAYQDALVENEGEGGAFPLLIFSPAWMGQRTASTFLIEELASQGFVVVSVDHTYYSGRVEFPDGRVFDASRAPEIGIFQNSTLEEQNARGDKYTLIEARDQIAVLNAMEAMNKDAGSPFFERLDMARVGALGHSIGGAAAVQACYMDDRIKAALNMDGWVFADVFHHGLSKPFFRMTGTPEVRPTSEQLASDAALSAYWQRNDDDEAAVTGMLRKHGGYELSIHGINHASFTERSLYSPVGRWGNPQDVPPALAYRIIDAYAVAFFSHYLSGTPEPLLEQNPSRYPQVQIITWPDPAPGKPPVSR